MALFQLVIKRLHVLYDLIQNEGLSLGTSCGVNIAGAIRLGRARLRKNN